MARWVARVESLEERTLLSTIEGGAAVVQALSPAPLAVSAAVDAASNPLGEGTVFAARIGVSGRTAPGAVVRIGKGDLAVRVVADAQGLFHASVPTSYGPSTIPISARDASGQTGTASLSVTRCNPVLAWNAAALEAIRLEKTPPPVAARALAILQLSVYNAVTAVDSGGPIATRAAASGAAHAALVALFPKEQTRFDAALAQADDTFGAGRIATRCVALGEQAAARVLASRAHDGSATQVAHTPSDAPGQWRPTPAAFAPALLPQWGDVAPFALQSGDQFRPDPPPALDSAAYAAAVNEVQAVGGVNSTVRTAEQTEIARFWSDGAGTQTPPGHWNTIAATVSMRRRDSLVKDARTFAALDVALADAAIACWDAKYQDNLWRPVTAIRLADTAGNPAVTADPSWTPLLGTPPFPSYVSGHSTFSGAAATVLNAAFGKNVGFTIKSDGLPGVTRSFSSFDQAAEEAGVSRIYGGIHFGFDNTAGLALGRRIGAYVLKNAPRAARS